MNRRHFLYALFLFVPLTLIAEPLVDSVPTPPPLPPSSGQNNAIDFLNEIKNRRPLKPTPEQQPKPRDRQSALLEELKNGITLRKIQQEEKKLQGLPSAQEQANLASEIAGLLKDVLNETTKKNNLSAFIEKFNKSLSAIPDIDIRTTIIKKSWENFLTTLLNAIPFSKKFDPVLTTPADKFTAAIIYLELDLFVLDEDQNSINDFNQKFVPLIGHNSLYDFFKETFMQKFIALNVNQATAQRLSEITSIIKTKTGGGRFFTKEEILLLAGYWTEDKKVFDLLLTEPKDTGLVQDTKARLDIINTLQDNKQLISAGIARSLNTRIKTKQITFNPQEQALVRKMCIEFKLPSKLNLVASLNEFGKNVLGIETTIGILDQLKQNTRGTEKARNEIFTRLMNVATELTISTFINCFTQSIQNLTTPQQIQAITQAWNKFLHALTNQQGLTSTITEFGISDIVITQNQEAIDTFNTEFLKTVDHQNINTLFQKEYDARIREFSNSAA